MGWSGPKWPPAQTRSTYRGFVGSETSYIRTSPWSQFEKNRYRSSIETSRSVTSPGTGMSQSSCSRASTSMTFSAA